MKKFEEKRKKRKVRNGKKETERKKTKQHRWASGQKGKSINKNKPSLNRQGRKIGGSSSYFDNELF